MFAALEIPDGDGTIIAATGQPLVIRAAPERQDRPLMGHAYPHALPTLQVPPAQPAITAATQQLCSGQTPGQRVHEGVWFAQAIEAFPTAHIPDEEFPLATAPAPTGQPRAIGAPCHAQDHATMPLQRSSKSAVGSPPQAHAAIIAATGQMRPVRTPLHTTDPG